MQQIQFHIPDKFTKFFLLQVLQRISIRFRDSNQTYNKDKRSIISFMYYLQARQILGLGDLYHKIVFRV